jgi:hypothetical protein
VTGRGLEALASMEDLNNLSLSGTEIGFGDFQKHLQDFKSLATIAIWDTPLSPSEIDHLQSSHKNIKVLGGFKDQSENLIKLNPPRLKNKSIVFHDSLQLQLFHAVRGVEIRYTVDGTEPDSIKSTVFEHHTVLKQTAAIKARAFKAGWLSSELATLNVYRSAHKPDTAILLSRLNRVHFAKGAQTFFDHELGSFNANSPAWANNWAGFIRNDMELLVRYYEPKKVTSVSLNTLIETENFIFPPASIEIWGGSSDSNLHFITRIRSELPATYSKPYIRLFDCRFEPEDVSVLKIIAKPVMKLPAWHKNKERPALLLIDEILIN